MLKNKSKNRFLRTSVMIGVILGSILIFIIYVYGSTVHEVANVAVTAERIYFVIGTYILENNGDFPKSEEELIHSNLLKKIENSDSIEYKGRITRLRMNNSEVDTGWTRLPALNRLRINYGIQLDEIELNIKGLYRSSSKEKILLINGPLGQKHSLEQIYYEPISVKWYALMLKEKQKVGDSQKR